VYHQRRVILAGRRRTPVGYEPTQRRPVRAQLGHVDRLAAPPQREDRFGERPERHRRADRAAAPAQQREVSGERPVDRLGGQPRLADPALSHQEHGTAAPLPCRLDRVGQQLGLGVAAYGRRCPDPHTGRQ
jgi:hypothetical protein